MVLFRRSGNLLAHRSHAFFNGVAAEECPLRRALISKPTAR